MPKKTEPSKNTNRAKLSRTWKSIGMKDAALFREQVYINGAWQDAEDGSTVDVTNPATGAVLGTVPNCGAKETRKAIQAANKAWPKWRAMTAKQRGVILRKWYELVIENQADLARLMTAEQGKPLAEAMGEIVYAASFLEWFGEEGKRLYGDHIPTHNPDRRTIVIKEPVGVAACITPWNFPAAMITRKAGPALAAGCPMIIKPAPDTPLSALALCELAERAGVPKGILSVVTGNAVAIGGELTSSPIVRKLSFTGSTGVGKLLMKQSADTMKKLSLELGGNAPFIVFEDANLDDAVAGAIMCKFRNTGQTCVCANRLLVQDSIYDAFMKKFAAAAKKLTVGNGLTDGDVQQGPLINMAAIDKVEKHIQDAISKGAKVMAGGKRHKLGGTFFQPTVLAGVTTKMAVSKEETFGPLAPVFRFKDEAEALKMANDTEFGLAAYYYTRDIGRVWRVAEGLEYGIIGCNTGVISTELAPFGGMKESGIGREGSKYGIEEYIEIKSIQMAGLDK
jgi:succinate-semialdehyde dehydrogenase/glutarate-semialdehyde dehydrogenase